MAQEDDMNTENKNSDYEELMKYLEEAQAYQTALILFEWDDETLAPEAAGSRTARMQGVLSASYQRIMMDPRVKELVDRCLDELEESRKTVSDGKTKEKEHLQTAENGVACSTRTDDTEHPPCYLESRKARDRGSLLHSAGRIPRLSGTDCKIDPYLDQSTERKRF